MKGTLLGHVASKRVTTGPLEVGQVSPLLRAVDMWRSSHRHFHTQGQAFMAANGLRFIEAVLIYPLGGGQACWFRHPG